jgi:ribosomal protein S18 acetylase RimI-like enzyme
MARATELPDTEVERFEARVPVRLRVCREDDLGALEWHGAFTHHRELIADAFLRQRRGEVVMLVADVGGWPVAQAWVDLTRMAAEGAGLVWAVRVIGALQGAGLGTRLVAAAERIVASRGLTAAEIRVEVENALALRLYERLGYRVSGRVRETYGYAPPDRPREEITVDEWILRKAVGRDRSVGPEVWR